MHASKPPYSLHKEYNVQRVRIKNYNIIVIFLPFEYNLIQCRKNRDVDE